MKQSTPRFVQKRDGRIVPFDQVRITNAIYKAAASLGGHDKTRSQQISDEVVYTLYHQFPNDDTLFSFLISRTILM